MSQSPSRYNLKKDCCTLLIKKLSRAVKKDCGIFASLPLPVLLKTITTSLIRLKMNNLLINKL